VVTGRRPNQRRPAEDGMRAAPPDTGPANAKEWIMRFASLRSKLYPRWVLALSLLVVAGFAHAEDGMVCGKPVEWGYMTVNISVKKTGQPPRKVSLRIYIYGDLDADQKAERIRDALNTGARSDTITATGTGSTVWVAGDNGWSVIGVTVGDDETKEPEKLLSVAPPSDQEALCSVSGEASGVTVDGAQAYLRVAIAGQTVFVPTYAGMPSLAVEQQLISLLLQHGVQARFATASDFANGFEDLQHDGRLVWMQPTDANGLEEELTDTGLLLDLAGVLQPQDDGTADLGDGLVSSRIELDANPGLFSSGPVHLRYALGGRRGPVDISIYDAIGRRVRGLVDAIPGPAGTLLWDGTDDRRTPVPSGVYFLRLSSPEGGVVRRVVRVGR
jgi:hypothetical protein